MAVRNLAESSFAGVTAMLQVYGRIVVAHAAGVSNLARNKFLSQDGDGTTAGNQGMFYRLPEELLLTAVMCAMQFAPNTRHAKSIDLES